MTSPHSFHIPVMGTGFTLDTPLRVARYGISSVMSLGDDMLMEQIRRHYCLQDGLPYEEIGGKEEDSRARRVTAYLNFLDAQVKRQALDLKNSGFGPGSELNRYFGLLPRGTLRRAWELLPHVAEGPERREAEAVLSELANPGDIDVNIMTKVDRWALQSGELLPADSTDALSGLRGFAKSSLESSVVFSAGMNPRLYGYLCHFDDFFPDENSKLKKKITLKVSDYRSAEIQGRFLAKKGLWISEFRVESGLNCGGHAFAAQGQLLGPILESFRDSWEQLRKDLYAAFKKALEKLGRPVPDAIPATRLSVQGGVGTASEQAQFLKNYGADSVGWGTPFLLVKEATLVDDEQRRRLAQAGPGDVLLSDSSPLGIPFWTLRTSDSEQLKLKRIAEGKPGSPCAHTYLNFNTEFGKPLCMASRHYQRLKLESLKKQNLTPSKLEAAQEQVISRACICMDLGAPAQVALGLETEAAPAVCPGPNLVWFKREYSLEEMVGHIYGRLDLLAEERRPHVFLSEIILSMEDMAREATKVAQGLSQKGSGYFEEYRANLLKGMEYYLQRSRELFGMSREVLEEIMREPLLALRELDTASLAT